MSKESVVKSEQQKHTARKDSVKSQWARITCVTKTCMRCGKQFEAKDAREIFCSCKCHDEQNAEYMKVAKTRFKNINDRMPSFCEAEIRIAISILRTFLAKTSLTKVDCLVGMGEVKAHLDRAADFNQMLAIAI